MLVLRGLVGLHRTVQLQLLQHYWLGHRLAAAAAAESLQSCPTLCDPRDGSPPGSPIPGILQARTLEWVAISFSRGIGLVYCDIEWFALETNRDHSVIFEIASKYCISDSFVDHDGYSISSKGFRPIVVDIMVI